MEPYHSDEDYIKKKQCYVVKKSSLFSNPVQYLSEHPVFEDQSCKIRNVVDFDISNWNKRS